MTLPVPRHDERQGLIMSSEEESEDGADELGLLSHKKSNHLQSDTRKRRIRSYYFNEDAYLAEGGLLRRIFYALYGEMDTQELIRVASLSSILCSIVGGYWLLRTLKDPVFAALVGWSYQPRAKILSLFVVLGLVLLLNRGLDSLPRHLIHRTFYLVGSVYSVLLFTIALCLNDPTLGLSNRATDPSRVLGWVSYCAIESYGSIMVALFWAFCNSRLSVQQKKQSYGLIVAGAQVGSIVGPSMATHARLTGIPALYMVAALTPLLMAGLVKTHVDRHGLMPRSRSSSSANNPPSPSRGGGGGQGRKEEQEQEQGGGAGLLEGLYLLLRYPYVMAIFGISFCFRIVVTLLDYQMKLLGQARFSSAADMASFMGWFGQSVNGLSLALSLLGTSFFIRRLGLRRTLLAFPLLLLLAVGCVTMSPSFRSTTWSLVFLKGLSYALHNPAKEILYSPTSLSVQYKSKTWIDMFGGRLAKASAAVVIDQVNAHRLLLVTAGNVVSLSFGLVLLVVAHWTGSQFDQLMSLGRVVGEEEEEGGGGGGEEKEEVGFLEEGVVQGGGDTSVSFGEDKEVAIGAEAEFGVKQSTVVEL